MKKLVDSFITKYGRMWYITFVLALMLILDYLVLSLLNGNWLKFDLFLLPVCIMLILTFLAKTIIVGVKDNPSGVKEKAKFTIWFITILLIFTLGTAGLFSR